MPTPPEKRHRESFYGKRKTTPGVVFQALYAILDFEEVQMRGLEPWAVLEDWLSAGIRLVQLRAKALSFGPFLEAADEAVRRGRQTGATIIVNDRADVAVASGAAGVHVGQHDLTPVEVRRHARPELIVGLSTHGVDQAKAACEAPIDYLAIGPVFATRTKRQPDPVVGLEGVRAAADLAKPLGLPVVAIGGITLDRAPDILAAGATSVAVISDLLTGDTRSRAREWMKIR